MSVPACGLPVALSVNVMVPARLTPLGDKPFVNLTPTVHVPPGTRTLPVNVSTPATGLKDQLRPPPPIPFVTATPVTVTGEVVEVLVRVTAPVPVIVPVANVIVKGLGVIDTVPGVTPVPLRAIGEPLLATLPPTVSVAFTNPPGAAVENTTLNVLVSPAASVPHQLPPPLPVHR